MAVDTKKLLDMPQKELDELFSASPPGDIPTGEGDGTVIVFPDSPMADIAAKVANLIAWKGKVFDPEDGTLVNKVTPFGIKNIQAKVFKAPSWFDGKECIVLDYSKTSLVAQWIRDEMRLVAPGLYLGIVFWNKDRVLNFALQFPTG